MVPLTPSLRVSVGVRGVDDRPDMEGQAEQIGIKHRQPAGGHCAGTGAGPTGASSPGDSGRAGKGTDEGPRQRRRLGGRFGAGGAPPRVGDLFESFGQRLDRRAAG